MPSFLTALLTAVGVEKDNSATIPTVVDSTSVDDKIVDYTCSDRVLTAAEVDAARLWELQSNEDFYDI